MIITPEVLTPPASTTNEAERLLSRVSQEQIRLLYRQIPIGLAGESLAAVFLCLTLWNIFPHWQLLCWTLFIVVVSGLGRGATAWLFHQNKARFSTRQWINLFSIETFFSGIAWGVAGSVFVDAPDLLHQTFVVFILLGITAAASTFYSVIMRVYILFLLPSILPFSFWLFIKGQDYFFLGVGSVIYIIAMLVSSWYSSKLLNCALTLQFEISDLDSDNKLLEKKVADRTAALEKALDFTKSTLDSTTDGIIMVDSKGMVEYFNQKFLAMWGITRKSVADKPFDTLVHAIKRQLKKPADLINSIKDVYRHKTSNSFIELNFIDGRVFECYSKPHWREGENIGHIWSFRDVTARNKLAHQANHDQLTDLPNRALFYDRVEQAIVFAKRRHTHLSLLFIDLDGFKIINDTLGHESGDTLLKEIARRLKNCIRDSDTVARFGGDEFVLLLMESEQAGILQLSPTILKTIAEPVKLLEQGVVVSASMGISMYPKDGTNAMTLLKNADMAMYLAKKKGGNNYQFYNEIIHQQSIEQLKLQTELYDALKNDEFFIEYQPIISLEQSTVIGAEALVRWRHPAKGILYPIDFIPVAEKNGLINQLGAWVFREACQQTRRWHDMGLFIGMSINISCAQMKGDAFIDIMENALTESRLDSKYMELEFTEKAIMESVEQIKATLSRFSKLGVQMAIDDFGTGYSSINYLKAFPINKLKIDRSFIHECLVNQDKKAIIKTIISMGKNLNLTVLAEGVETEEQLRFLKENLCDEVQGNLFSQSVDAQEFPKLVKRDFKALIKGVFLDERS